MHIPAHERNYLGSTLQTDLNGQVFEYQGDIYRCIYPERVAFIKSLFDRGVIEHLVNEGLIVGTELTDHTTDDFGLVLKHERLPVIIDPSEWSLPILKKGALHTLALMRVLHAYDLTLVDGTVLNISVIPGGKVVMHDVTSIVPLENYQIYDNGLNSFAHAFYYKLKVQEKFGSYSLLQQLNLHLPITKALFYRLSRPRQFRWLYGDSAPAQVSDLQSTPESRWINPHDYQPFIYGPIQTLARIGRGLRQKLSPASDEEIDARTKAAMLRQIESLEREISAMDLSPGSTYWGSYYGEVKPGEAGKYERERVIQKRLQEIAPPQVADMGSNMGYFSFMAAEIAPIVLAVDYDNVAVGRLTDFLGTEEAPPERTKIIPAIASFPILSDDQIARFRSHTVMALAITHHLLLTQRVPVDQIVDKLARLAEAHLLVEFMPHGLGPKGTDVPDPLPESYTLEVFKAALQERFASVEEVEYDQSDAVTLRILLHCRKG